MFALEPGSATPVALTANLGNSVSTVNVEPPTAVSTSMQLNLSPLGLPLLTCKVTVSWTASASAGVDGYEVRRTVSGVPTAGPWSVAGSPFVDPEVPLATAATVASWQVRSKLAGSTWRSEWVTAADTGLLPCLLPLGERTATPDSTEPDVPATTRVVDEGVATTVPVDVPLSSTGPPQQDDQSVATSTPVDSPVPADASATDLDVIEDAAAIPASATTVPPPTPTGADDVGSTTSTTVDPSWLPSEPGT